MIIPYLMHWNIISPDFAFRFGCFGKKKDAEMFYKRSWDTNIIIVKNLVLSDPILPDGTFYSPFQSEAGREL